MTGPRPFDPLHPEVGAPADITAISNARELIIKGQVVNAPPSFEFRRRLAAQLVDQLGADYDFGALDRALQQTDVIAPLGMDRTLLSDVADIGRKFAALEASQRATSTVVAGTVGITRGLTGGAAPDPTEGQNQGAKAVGEMLAVGFLGVGTYKAVGMLSGAPRIAPFLAGLGTRTREVLTGAVTGGVVEALRPDGVPEETSVIDVSGKIGKLLQPALGERGAMAVGGALFGGALDLTVGNIIRGVSNFKVDRILSKLPEEDFTKLSESLKRAGVEVPINTDRRGLVTLLEANKSKVVMSGDIAELWAKADARAAYLAQFLYDNPKFSADILPGAERSVALEAQIAKGTLIASGTPLHSTQDIDSAISILESGLRPGSMVDIGSGKAGGLVTFEFVGRPAGTRLAHEATVTTRGTPKIKRILFDVQELSDPDAAKTAFDRLKLAADKHGIPLVPATQTDQGFKVLAGEPIFPAPAYANLTTMSTKRLSRLFERTSDETLGLRISHELDRRGAILPDGTINLEAGPISSHTRQDALYIASRFVATPRGMTVIEGISDPAAITEAGRLLGINVIGAKIGDHAIILRPQVQLPEGTIPKGAQEHLAHLFRSTVVAQNRGTAKQAVLNILPDGRAVTGGYRDSEMAEQLGLSIPKIAGVDRADIAIREGLGLARIEMIGADEMTLTIPHNLSRAQMNKIVAEVEKIGPGRVVINPIVTGKPQVALNNPIGMQIEDAIAGLLPGNKKAIIPEIVSKRLAQLEKEGLFTGQAAIIGDNGMAVEVVKRLGKNHTQVRDPFTRELIKVHNDRLALLPHTLEGELSVNQLVMSAMTPAEREMRLKILQQINLGLTRPIKRFADLEEFARTRGFFLNRQEKGIISVFDPNTGESVQLENITEAAKWLRAHQAPVPDITPPEITGILGGKNNIGGFGGGSPPPRFHESVPIGPEDFDPETLKGIVADAGVPGALRKFITPTRGLLLDIERIYKVPVGRAFLAIDEQVVHKKNFMAAWLTGEAPGMPKGIKPLSKIVGRDIDGNKITEWIESAADATKRAEVVSRMTPKEVTAAKDYEKWVHALADNLGVDRNLLEDAIPHMRRWTDQYGNDVAELWKKTRGTPVPRSLQTLEPYIKDGVFQIHETDAFKIGSMMADSFGNVKYMAGVMDEAKQLLWNIPDQAVKVPLAQYIEALRGVAFKGQREALQTSVEALLKAVGVTPKHISTLAENLTLNAIGLSYNATMAFRPGLAIRNLTQTLQTTWAMYGDTGDTIAEAMARAMTLAGRDQAITDGAIVVNTGSVFAAEEIYAAMPSWLRKMSNAGMKLYNGADNYTRATAYWTARIRAEKALAKFATATKGAKAADYELARRQLILDSGLYTMDKPVVAEFFRRLETSPEAALGFFGKNAADVTQWMYGRGNQPWWMRTVFGRLMGQYGTWPLWYMDFLKRTTRNMVQNGYGLQAVRFLGRVAIANGAMGVAGAAIGVQLGKWSGVSSFFFTGGPGAEVLGGIVSLVRGTGNVLFEEDNAFGKSRMTEGARILARVSEAYIPGSYVVRDITRFVEGLKESDRRFSLAAILAAQVGSDATIQQKLDILSTAASGRTSTDIDIEARMQGRLTAVESVQEALRAARQGQQSGTGQNQSARSSSQTMLRQGGVGAPAPGSAVPNVPAPSVPQLPQGRTGPAESKPVRF